MPTSTTTENHAITYPAEGATGWYATWETLIQDITDNFDNITNFRAAIIKDTGGNESIVITATGSAVNHLGVTNAATGNHPNIAALGDDTDINVEIASKGTGTIELQDATNITGNTAVTGTLSATSTAQIDGNILDSNGNEIIEKTNTASAVNHPKITNSATGNAPKIEAAGDDTNINLIVDGKGTGSVIVNNLVAGQATNLGITYSSSTLSVSGAAAALSSSNPGFVCLPSKSSPGRNITIEVTSDQGFIDATGASEITGNLFGATTGVAWGSDCPFYIYAVSSDDEASVAFMCSRISHLSTSPVVGEIGAPDDSVADEQFSFFSFDNIDETLYDENPCVCIGSFRMQMSSSDDWTVQALSTDDGIGRFQEHIPFTFPQAQMGAQASSYIVSTAGTEPTWSTERYIYYICRDGYVKCTLDFLNAVAGSGTQDIEIVIPFSPKSETAGATIFLGNITYEESGVGNFLLHASQEVNGDDFSFMIWDGSGFITPSSGDRIENEDVDTNDDLFGRLHYPIRDS